MANRKREIIKTTAGVIHAKGYESTKLSDILSEAQIGKGQFYHYFSSKRDLGIAVVDHFVEKWERDLIQNILSTNESPEVKLNKMLSWAIHYHETEANMHGCPFGNLALEMSEHDEVFREKINGLLDQWIARLSDVLEDLMVEEPYKHAQTIVAQLEGGILLMKNYQDIMILKNITDTIRFHYLNNKGGH